MVRVQSCIHIRADVARQVGGQVVVCHISCSHVRIHNIQGFGDVGWFHGVRFAGITGVRRFNYIRASIRNPVDALVVDTSDMDESQVVTHLLELVTQHAGVRR